MMQVNGDTKLARDTVRALRAMAPIAGQFEDCIQVFGKLSSALEACRRGIEKWSDKKQATSTKHDLKETSTLLDEALTKFKTWDRDMSASSRALDHALRGSRQLSHITVVHLQELYEVLEQGIKSIPPRYWDLPSEPDLLPLPDEDDTSLVDQESDEEAEKLIDDVLDIISCLYDIQDNLSCPEEDWEATDLSEEETKIIVNLAHAIFPKAPEYLRERLVASSAKSRQRQKALGQGDTHNRSRPGSIGHFSSKGVSSYGWRRPRRGFAASDDGGSVAMSTLATIFSEGTFPSTAGGTSIGDFLEPMMPSLKAPKLPEGLRKGSPANCRFCGFQLPFSSYNEDDVVRMGDEEWEQHVFQDLQPYVCTFEDCMQPQQTFGLQSHWFQHETFEHRTTEVWRCGGRNCQTEFGNQEEYEDHLRTTHSDILSSTDLDALAQQFKQLSLPSTESHTCSICDQSLPDMSRLKSHVASHMEVFAFASMQALNGASGEDDDDMELEEQSDEEIQPVILDLIHDNEINFPNSRQLLRGSQPERQIPNSNALKVPREQDLVHFDSGQAKTKKSEERRDRVQSLLVNRPAPSQLSDQLTPEATVWSHMPQRNTGFVGRETDLRIVHDTLAIPGQLCILSGQGGIGKTATSIEYCFQNENHYRYIFWVKAENAGSCAETFAHIAGELCQVDISRHTQAALIGMAQEQLNRTELRWLLVFDNVEKMTDLDVFLPRKLRRTQGSVLVTTRENDLPEGELKNFQEHHLQELTVEDSTHLLLTSMQSDAGHDKAFDPRQHPDYEYAVEASRRVGRLPLAIGMVAGYIKASRASLDMFLDIWEEQQDRRSLETHDPHLRSSGIDASIDKLWDIGISELMMKARNFLHIISFLNPEAIQKDLLISDHQEQSLDFPNPREKTRYKIMIDQLTARQLISIKQLDEETEAYSIHRLLQKKILEDMTAPEFADTFERVFNLVRLKYPRSSVTQIPEPDTWPACERYMPHVFSLHRIYKDNRSIRDSVPLAELFYDAGFHIWERDTAAYDGAGFLASALLILDNLGIDEFAKIRGDIHNIMGKFYSAMGAMWRERSVVEHTQALVIRQKRYNDNREDKMADILLRNATNDLAGVLLGQNRFEEAAVAFQVCFKQYKLWGSEEELPFEYQKYYSNYGLVKAWRGQYAEAIASLRRSTELSKMHSTKTWHYCMNSFWLGCVLLQSGDLQGALDTHLETLKLRADLYGKHEAATIISSYSVGAIYHHMGDPHSAFEYFRECVDSAKTASRLPEEAYGKIMHHLSIIQRELGLKDDAERSSGKAMNILEKFMDYMAPCVKEEGDVMMMFDDLQALFEGRWTGTKLLKHMQQCEMCREKAESVVNYPGRRPSPERQELSGSHQGRERSSDYSFLVLSAVCSD